MGFDGPGLGGVRFVTGGEFAGILGGKLAPSGTGGIEFRRGLGGKEGISTSLQVCPQADDDEIYGTGHGNHTKAPHYPKYSRLKTFLLS